MGDAVFVEVGVGDGQAAFEFMPAIGIDFALEAFGADAGAVLITCAAGEESFVGDGEGEQAWLVAAFFDGEAVFAQLGGDNEAGELDLNGVAQSASLG